MFESEQSRGAARALEPTEGSLLAFDLAGQIEQLRREPYWQSGRNSKTIVHYPDLRVVLTAIQAKTTIHEHRSAGRILVETIQGRLRALSGGKEFDLPTGGVLVLDRDIPYELTAVENSAFLLVIAWPAGE